MDVENFKIILSIDGEPERELREDGSLVEIPKKKRKKESFSKSQPKNRKKRQPERLEKLEETMEKKIETAINELEVVDEYKSGYMYIEGLEKVCYVFDAEEREKKDEDDRVVNAKNPSVWNLLNDLNLDQASDERTLVVEVLKSVPDKFKKILLYHAVINANAMLNENKESKEAYKIASKAHQEYANKVLEEELFKEFLNWRKTTDYEK